MRYYSLPLLFVLAVASVVSAQTAPGGSAMLEGAPGQENCPVGFSAHRHDLTAIVRNVNDAQTPMVKPSLRVNFELGRTPPIASMKMVLSGSNGKADIVLTGKGQAAHFVSEPVQLTSRDGRFAAVQYVAAHAIPLIQRLEITEIVYQDGTAWHEPAPNACVATPSLFVPVDAVAQRP